MTTDFKKPKRIKDPAATAKAVYLYPLCAACGGRAETGDHVIRRSQQGDDVIENIVGLCGHGTAGCHGAKHGNSYEWRPQDAQIEGYGWVRERRDASWVARHVGLTLCRERQDVIWYVLGKLGVEPGLEFLKRHYLIEPIYVRNLPGFPA